MRALSPEHRAKISASLMGNQNGLGRTYSAAYRKKQSLAHIRHGHCAPRTPTYRSWALMVARCYNQKHSRFADWGGRGITVCERWRIFENFLADMGERPAGKTLDRIDNEGHYEPGNVRWATASEQQRNQRPRRKQVAA